MKALYRIWDLGLILCLILISCESENIDPEFSVEFQDGTIIDEKDIAFYDSSTAILFLNGKLYLDYGSEGYPLTDHFKFSAFVQNDTIFQGIIFPRYHYNNAVYTPYINSKTFPAFESDVLPFGVPSHIMKDPRIIESLGKSNLLRKGITCTINSMKISANNDSSATLTFTVKNHDPINYYVPDPEKMSAARFDYVFLIFSLSDDKTHESIWPSNDYPLNMNNLSMDDLSILEANSEVTYTFKSSYNTSITTGLYSYSLYYTTLLHPKPFSIPLDQDNGRVWVGAVRISGKDILIE